MVQLLESQNPLVTIIFIELHVNLTLERIIIGIEELVLLFRYLPCMDLFAALVHLTEEGFVLVLHRLIHDSLSVLFQDGLGTFDCLEGEI